MKRIVVLIASACFVLGSVGLGGAQAMDGSPPPDGDREVVTTIVMNAVTQVKLCDFALEKTHNADVRGMCRKTSADNARIAISGMQLAQKIGATDAKLAPLPDTAEMVDSLGLLSDADFDREFLLAKISSDEKSELDIRYAIEVTTDTAVKRYENGVLPSVQKQLDLAESTLRGISEAAL